MSIGKWKKPVNTFLATSLVAGVVVPAVPATVNAETVATDLIISEYIEGSSYNKAIEIYNGTGAAVDLSEYSLELHSNGAVAVGQKLNLTGTLEQGATYVIHHKDANAAIKAKGNLVNSSVINFNGDDPIVLKKNGTVIDSIGQVGKQIKFGEDVTLVRNSNVTSGDTIIDDAFDRAAEWTKLSKDDSSNLGLHTMDGSSSEEPDPDTDPEDPKDPPETENPDPAATISIADARSSAIGKTVTIKGVVAANLKNTISVQDETGGIAVRPTSLNLNVGDEVTLTGTLAEFKGLLQLDGATIVEKTANAGVPTPKVVTGAEVVEENESQLVTVKDVTLESVDAGSGWANYIASDGTEFIVRDENNVLGLEVGNTYESITGIVQQFDADYQIIPRSVQDIVVDSSIIQPAIANPGSGTFVGETTVTLSTTTAGAKIYYTIDGTEPTDTSLEYTTPIKITEDTTLKAIVITEAENSEVKTFEYAITDSLQIHDIQGEGHASPFDGKSVEGIEGIVTYSFELNGANYYHIQTPDKLKDDNPNTSEGIILYSGNKKWPVKVGDLVSVKGQVSEYAIDGFNDRQETDMKVTQINVRDDRGGNVTVLESGVELPKPVIIDEEKMSMTAIDSDQLKVFNPEVDAIDFWESIEGMRVQVGNVKAVSPQEHGDLITVLEDAPTNTLHGGLLLEEENQNPNRIQFRLEPNGPARDFEVATGDKFEGPITGVVGYSFQNYKIYVPLDEMEAAHVKGEAKPEKTTIEYAEEKLTIASYNLENFSNNKSSSSDDKARKLARAFAEDMQNPDIIGVTEVQDNNGAVAGDSYADESYERLIKAIKDAGGVEYEYANIDPVNNQDGGAPNANIRVGFLYNPERVTLTEDIPHGDATTAVGYENGKLTHNPGRIDPKNSAFDSSRKPLAAQFDFQGEEVIVIANHWNSKGGDTPLFGSKQPPVYGSEVQRKQIAEIVHDFVADIKTKNPEANVVSVGDFNDFQFSEALKIHEGDHMTNMINKLDDKDRYTYLYQGNSQVLDHILVTNNLVEQTEIDVLHINADFTDMAGRASDHDPVMVQIDFGEEVIEGPLFTAEGDKFAETLTLKFTDRLFGGPITATADGIEGTNGEFENGQVVVQFGHDINDQSLFEITVGAGEEAAVYVVTYDVITMVWSVSPKQETPTPMPMEAEKAYNLKDFHTKKLTIQKPSVSITLDNTSVIENGIEFTGEYAEFDGAGFEKTSVTINPEKADAIIDFKGTNVQKVIIDGTNVKEIRGAENIQIEYRNGASAGQIKFFNSKGEPIEVPSFSDENNSPVVKKTIPNQTLTVGESLTLQLTDHFADPENEELTFTATKGIVVGSSLKLELEKGTHNVGVTASDGQHSVTTNFSISVIAVDSPVDEYYKDAVGKEGQALKAVLHEIIDDHKQLSYSEVWNALRETDEDPNNPDNVRLFYSGDSRSKARNGGNVGDWNREHVWAKSHGDFGTSKGPGTDIHHLRPTDVQVNSSRSNLDFDYGGNAVKGCNECKSTKNSWEPPNDVKGDVARMLFYMATRYEKGDKVDLELNEKLNNGKNPYHGKLSVLLEWNEADPVDEYEMNRNNVIQEWQGNRNPFIDNPEWAESIWGQTP